VAARTVVVDLDVFEHCAREFQPGPPLLPVQQLHLHGAPEGFDRRTVIAVPDGSHRSDRARLTNPTGECPRGELGPVVSVYVGVYRFPRFNGHIEGIQHEVSGLPGINRPADDFRRINVGHSSNYVSPPWWGGP
jgi:hypothetical protein